MRTMPKHVADAFAERRRIAVEIEDEAELKAALLAITADEDPFLGADDKIEGIRANYGVSTEEAQAKAKNTV